MSDLGRVALLSLMRLVCARHDHLVSNPVERDFNRRGLVSRTGSAEKDEAERGMACSKFPFQATLIIERRTAN